MLSVLGALYRMVLRPILFLVDAERAHQMAAVVLRALHRWRWPRALCGKPPRLPVEALGRTFRSPVGVAAGFDKSAAMYEGLGALGFGFVEIGTVTAQAQPGNDRPRLFRLPRDRALLNRMGFNNPGAAAVARALAGHPLEDLAVAGLGSDRIAIGINIGKSKVTPLADAPADYAESARLLGPHADYMVVNVSSPNTPGLRSLQALGPLRAILEAVQRALAHLPRRVPLLVKIAPDLTDEDLDAVCDLAIELGLAGIVAANTTIARQSLRSETASFGEGGISGAPLRERLLAILHRLHARAGSRLTLIASGGIETAADARAAIDAGATLVQVYTALVYRGPTVARDLVRGLKDKS